MELPLEVVWLVLKLLDVADLLRAQLVCVAWRGLIRSEKSASLWKCAYFVTWPLPEPDADNREEKFPPLDPPKWRSIARWRLARHLESSCAVWRVRCVRLNMSCGDHNDLTRGPWLDDPNHQVTRLVRQLTDQLQQVPDVEQEERTKRKGNSQIKWLNGLLKRTSDNATLLKSVSSVRRQLLR